MFKRCVHVEFCNLIITRLARVSPSGIMYSVVDGVDVMICAVFSL